MTLPPDPPDATEPGGTGSAVDHGALLTLARRGTERGAVAVLDRARHDARRHRHRRRVGTGALAMALVAGIVGAGALVLRGDPPRVTAGDPPAGGGDPQPRVVTGVRIVEHDGFDRIEIELAGDPIPRERWPRPDPESPLNDPLAPHNIAACRKPGFDPASGVTRSVLSDVAPTPDGLPAELSGRVFTGDGSHVREVIPLCAVEGHTFLGVVLADPSLMQRDITLPPDGDLTGDPLEGYDWTGELSFRPCKSDDPQRELFEFFRYDDPDGNLPDRLCEGPPPAAGVN